MNSVALERIDPNRQRERERKDTHKPRKIGF